MDRLQETKIAALASLGRSLSGLQPTCYYGHLAQPEGGLRQQVLKGLSVGSSCTSAEGSGLEAREGVEQRNKDNYFPIFFFHLTPVNRHLPRCVEHCFLESFGGRLHRHPFPYGGYRSHVPSARGCSKDGPESAGKGPPGAWSGPVLANRGRMGATCTRFSSSRWHINIKSKIKQVKLILMMYFT